jgi:hypothetical protein
MTSHACSVSCVSPPRAMSSPSSAVIKRTPGRRASRRAALASTVRGHLLFSCDTSRQENALAAQSPRSPAKGRPCRVAEGASSNPALSAKLERPHPGPFQYRARTLFSSLRAAGSTTRPAARGGATSSLRGSDADSGRAPRCETPLSRPGGAFRGLQSLPVGHSPRASPASRLGDSVRVRVHALQRSQSVCPSPAAPA